MKNSMIQDVTNYKFEFWMRDVNRTMQSLVSLSVEDFVDCPYRDWFDEGMEPDDAARKAIGIVLDEEEN